MLASSKRVTAKGKEARHCMAEANQQWAYNGAARTRLPWPWICVFVRQSHEHVTFSCINHTGTRTYECGRDNYDDYHDPPSPSQSPSPSPSLAITIVIAIAIVIVISVTIAVAIAVAIAITITIVIHKSVKCFTA